MPSPASPPPAPQPAATGEDDPILPLPPPIKTQQPAVSARPPLWAWLALIVAVISCSSGGMWFALMPPSCPPILKASWRLQLTFVLQLPGFIHSWFRASVELKYQWRRSLAKMCFVGMVLAAHFASWSESLAYTSLSNSLLFVTTTPLLLVGFSGAMYSMRWCAQRWWGCLVTDPYPPTILEVFGALVGLVAAAMLASDSSNASANAPPAPLLGDMLALLGAAFMGIYLSVGYALRQWMPLWLYVTPVTLVAAITAALASLAIEHSQVQGTQVNSVFGEFGSPAWFGLAMGAALTAGILGHTAANLAMEHISPLIVSVLLLWEPLIGSVMGYLVGVQAPPDLVVYLAGFPLMLSAVLVVLGKRNTVLHKRFEAWCRPQHQGGGGGGGKGFSALKTHDTASLAEEEDEEENGAV
jgi:drug/metabolite transporter (DMT)-like permease